MAHPTRGGLSFTPTLEEFAKERAGSHLTVLSGSNNSGKSLVLKWLKSTMGKSAYMIGTNRFYHVYQISSGIREDNEVDQFESNFQSHFSSEQYNHEHNYLDLSRIIIGLSDDQRAKLFSLCSELIGSPFTMKRVKPDNELSVRYIDVGGQNLSVASSGTRLLLTLLGICMDDRFKTLLIDEPELGLSPRLQSSLSRFLGDPAEREKYFPHLKQVILATHSQLMLNRRDLQSNYIVRKSGSDISLSRVTSIDQFHQLQFNLLGNSLDGLFFPSAIVYVEGETDERYITAVLTNKYPGRNVVIVRTGGDPKRKLQGLRETMGDLSKSPLRPRIFVVVDSVHAGGLKADLVQMGLLDTNFIAWTKNGIEYLYPEVVLGEIYQCEPAATSALAINGDDVSLNGITYKKAALGSEVAKRHMPSTPLPAELTTKLVEPLGKAIE